MHYINGGGGDKPYNTQHGGGTMAHTIKQTKLIWDELVEPIQCFNDASHPITLYASHECDDGDDCQNDNYDCQYHIIGLCNKCNCIYTCVNAIDDDDNLLVTKYNAMGVM